MGRGRKKLPKETKQLHGTYRPSRDNLEQPRFDPLDLAKYPEGLNPAAQDLYESIIPILDEAGVLQKTDKALVVSFANEYFLYWELDNIVKDLLPQVKADPLDEELCNTFGKYRRLQQQAWETCRKSMIEMGMTPTARQKIIINQEEETEDILDL